MLLRAEPGCGPGPGTGAVPHVVLPGQPLLSRPRPIPAWKSRRPSLHPAQLSGWVPPTKATSPVRACPFRRAAAVVSVHTVHAGAPVLAAVSGTVIYVLLTVLTREACGRGRAGLSLPGAGCWAPASLAPKKGTAALPRPCLGPGVCCCVSRPCPVPIGDTLLSEDHHANGQLSRGSTTNPRPQFLSAAGRPWSPRLQPGA